jgi:XTP/dITP diphosphohydrolase
MRECIVATGNEGKLVEIRDILAGLPLSLSALSSRWNPVPDIPETGSTFLENARQKAAWVFDKTGIWTLADDSGLEVDALDGAPGVLSARYAGPHGNSAANNARLLKELDGLPLERRTARFKCVVVLMTSKDAFYAAEGVCEGRIIFSPRGTGGFGYDPLFEPVGYERSFAEIPASEKHAISHRGRALAQLRSYLDQL